MDCGTPVSTPGRPWPLGACDSGSPSEGPRSSRRNPSQASLEGRLTGTDHKHSEPFLWFKPLQLSCLRTQVCSQNKGGAGISLNCFAVGNGTFFPVQREPKKLSLGPEDSREEVRAHPEPSLRTCRHGEV